MRTTFSAIAALAAVAGAQSTTIDVDAISVAIPTSVFVLPVVYVTAENAPTLTATTLAASATPSSDSQATAVFDSAADVTAAIISASQAAAASATAAVEKRDGNCVQQPIGISHASLPDTAAGFASDAWYGAQAVAADTPIGFVRTFSNLTASNSADQYMGFTLLTSYDVVTCGIKCSAISGCNSFNIYFERDPQYDPSVAGCSNPPSTTNVKCVFWGGALTSDNANNFGQMRDGFNVVIAGSNGYIANAYAAKLAAKATTTSSSSSAAAFATDAAGNIYTVYYSSDSTQGAYSNAQAANSYTDCMTACDNAASSGCTAFTYVGGTNGAGSGTCWLKEMLGSASPAGSNVLSGVRSGKAVSSSSSSVVSTTSSSSRSSSSSASTSSVSKTSSSISSTSSSSITSTTTSSSSIASTTTSSSSIASTTTSSSSITSTTTSSSSITSTTTSSSSIASTTTSLSAPVTPTTMSTSTKSSSSTSSSSTTSTAPTALSTGFYIFTSPGSYIKVASGSNAPATYTSQASATKFQLDPTTGYLLEANGNNIGYAASMPQGVQANQKLLWNSPTSAAAASNNYIKCSIDENAGFLSCSAGGQPQQAYACSSGPWASLFFGPDIPFGCDWIGLYRQSTAI